MPHEGGRLRVLIVGSGIAGLTAALAAAADGHDVTVATKSTLDDTATAHAQGGIAAVLAAGADADADADAGDPADAGAGASASDTADDTAGDTVASHVRDTLTAGAGLGDRRAIMVLCGSADARIRDLIDLGTRFDVASSGQLARGLEAAHAHPRILHAFGDGTGREIQRALSEAVRAAAGRGELRLLEHTFLVDLAQEPARTQNPEVAALRVVGAWLQTSDGANVAAPHLFDADAVVLATGGAGQLFAHTSNPDVATGDGIAAAVRAGAKIADLEFVQFHPTVLAGSGGALISEAVRGEGAVLLNDAGERFLVGVHPDAELAPRDVVARGIADEMAKQDGRPVLLDARHLGREFLERRFPSITARIDASGLDWSRETVPVTPAAHYLMGGVVTDLSGRTSIPGLYAAGETARTGVHGANRLASNSLLEGAVFGRRVAEALLEQTHAARRSADGSADHSADADADSGYDADADYDADGSADADAGHERSPFADQLQCKFAPTEAVQPFSRQNCTEVGQATSHDAAFPFSRGALQALMWRNAGLHRSRPALEEASRTLNAWAGAQRSPKTHAVLAEREDANLLLLAQLTVAAALARAESAGAHYRTDHPAVPGSQPVAREPHSPSAAPSSLRRPLPQKAMAH